jgi:hypothetical protein
MSDEAEMEQPNRTLRRQSINLGAIHINENRKRIRPTNSPIFHTLNSASAQPSNVQMQGVIEEEDYAELEEEEELQERKEKSKGEGDILLRQLFCAKPTTTTNHSSSGNLGAIPSGYRVLHKAKKVKRSDV